MGEGGHWGLLIFQCCINCTKYTEALKSEWFSDLRWGVGVHIFEGMDGGQQSLIYE